MAFVVVLKAALHQGLNAARLSHLRIVLPEMDRRTLERWLRWWREIFGESPFWKTGCARFMPPLSEAQLPLGLCERFGIEPTERLLDLLRWLAPITTRSRIAEVVM